jgi:hypothetical protein
MEQFYFNSIAELLTAIETQEKAGKGTKTQLIYFRDLPTEDRRQWLGGIKDLTEYKQTLVSGYLPAVEELNTGTATNEGNENIFIPSVSGQFNDVDAYLTGQPECMADFETQEANKYLVLNISGVTPAKMNAAQIMEKCKAVFSAVNFLEAKNTRVKIYLTVSVNDTKSRRMQEVKILIKDFSDNFVPTFHGLLIGHLTTIRGLIYAYLSIHNKCRTLGRCIETQPAAGETLISYWMQTAEQIKQIILLN